MEDLFIGYTNPSGKADAGAPELREKLYLTPADLITHIHGVGASRSGKSKFMEWFCRQLTRQGCGFLLLDPQGRLSLELIRYFACLRPSQPILYFDPSRSDFLIPFNPFLAGEGDVSTRVAKQVEATLRVWGVDRSDETPRLERWLTCVYHVFSTGKVSINEVDELLSWGHPRVRAYAAELLKDHPVIQNEWLELGSLKRLEEFLRQIESTRNRIFRFSEPEQLRRILSIEERSLDFRALFEKGAIVIMNLQETDCFSEAHGRLIGTLAIHDLWAAARRYGPAERPYFLLVDEVQRFVTPDIREILDRGGGKGLHAGLFHQHLGQLEEQDAWTYQSIMSNARVKLAFGGLTKPDASRMVDEIFTNQIDYDEIKLVLESTRFWPRYARDKVYTSSRGGGQAQSSGGSWNPYLEEWIPSENTTDTDTWQEGESDIPILLPEPFREVSAITPFTLEEQRNKLSDSLMEQFQRHFLLRRPGEKTIAAVTPFVREFRLFPKEEERAILENFIKPYALAVGEIDRTLAAQKARLLIEAKKPTGKRDHEGSFKEPK